MTERPDQQQIADKIDQHRSNRDADRQSRILPGMKAGGEHLDQYIGRQPERKCRQGMRRRQRIFSAERSILQQAAYDRFGRHGQRRRCGQGKQQHELDSAILSMDCNRFLSCPQLPRERRQHGGTNADTDKAERQLVEPIGVIKIGYSAFGQEARCQRGRDQQIKLNGARAERRRKDQLEQRSDLGGKLRPAQLQADIGAPTRP